MGANWKCPSCGRQTIRVLETRHKKDNSIRRRRDCLFCDYRFTTYERVDGHFKPNPYSSPKKWA